MQIIVIIIIYLGHRMHRYFIFTLTLLSFLIGTSHANDEKTSLISQKIALSGNIYLIKNKKLVLTSESPLPVYGKITGLCFKIGEPLEFKENTDEVSMPVLLNWLQKETSLLLTEVLHEEKQDQPLFNFGSAFITGHAIDYSGKNFIFSDKRTVSANKIENTDQVIAPHQVQVCTNILNPNKKIQKIELTPIHSFSSKEIFWYTSNIAEMADE